jgi:hypothetical protein
LTRKVDLDHDHDHDHDHDLKTFYNAYAVHQENDSNNLATIYFIWFTG